MTHPPLPIHFYNSRKYALRTLLSCLGVIAASVFVWLYPEKIGEAPDGFGVHLFTGALIALSALGAAASAFSVTKQRLAFSFTEEGIVFNEKAPIVQWEEITEARPVAGKGQAHLVGIFLKNAESYYAKFDGSRFSELGRYSMDFMVKQIGTPVALPAKMVDVKPQALADLVNSIVQEKAGGRG